MTAHIKINLVNNVIVALIDLNLYIYTFGIELIVGNDYRFYQIYTRKYIVD